MDWHARNANFNDLIKQLFHEKEVEKRAEAARQLGFLKDGRAVNLLCRALKNEEESMVVNRIIEALGQIADGRATLRIIEKLKDEIKKPEIELDKLKVIFIIESFAKIKDKRALEYIGHFLKSSDDKLRQLTENTFDEIEPDWRRIVEKARRERSIPDIFKVNM
jgi:HEAT repeat protein